MSINTLTKARKTLGAEEYNKALRHTLTALPAEEKKRISHLLTRMKVLSGLRSLQLPDALDLLVRLGVVLESNHDSQPPARP